MVALRKYMFDLDFDAAPPPAPEPAPAVDGDEAAPMQAEAPPPPTFSEFEMEEARRVAFSEGRDQGVKEAAQVTERRHAEAMAALAKGFAATVAAQKEGIDSARREAALLAVAVVKKLHPEMARLHGLDEIAGVIRECLLQIEETARLMVRTHPDLLEGVRTEAAKVAEEAEFEGKIVFAADPKLALGDCRVEWDNGGADRDQALLMAEIDTIVTRAIEGMRAGAGRASAAS